MTLLLLHGTGGDENDLLALGREISPKASLLSPRGKVSENGMPRFFRRLAEGVFDMDDLVFRTNELADFLKASAKVYGFDTRRVIAVGYSNGANIASSLLLLHPGLLEAVILFHPMVPFVPKKLPDLSNVGVLISAGLKDPIASVEQTKKLFELLKDCHAEVTLHWQSSAHSITWPEISLAEEWLSGRAPQH